MYSIAGKINGTPVNESNLRAFAASRITEADSKLKTLGGADFGDAEWRFEAAKDEFGGEAFAGSVFDSDYLISAIASLNRSQDEQSFVETEMESQRLWNGMWAALYGNNAKYLYLKSNALGGSAASSFMLETYADQLDSDTVKMRELYETSAAVESTGTAVGVSGQTPLEHGSELALLLVFCVIIAIFLNIVQFFRS
jgi:hypothetical protein